MGIIPRSGARALALLLLATCVGAAQQTYYDPSHPTDQPLTRCTGPLGYDPFTPERTRYQAIIEPPSSSWLDDPGTKPWYYERLGDNAYQAGRNAQAMREYRATAALLLGATPTRYVSFNLDALLRTGQQLYRLNDRHTAGKLWMAYLQRSQTPDYYPMAHALKMGQYRYVFNLMLKDSSSFTQRNPIDLESGGLQWIVAGAERGSHGDYAAAQHDFWEATRCRLWDPAYAVFAWGAARYAQSARGDAHTAWFEAVGEGDSSPDMPFNNNANAAAVTMLVTLY